MKKAVYLFILLLLLFPTKIIAGEIHGDCSIGYVPKVKSLCTNLSVRYDFWIMSVGCGIETLAESSPKSALFFCPYRNVYYFETEIKPFNPFYIDFKHSCTHAIWSYKKQFYDKYEGGNRTTISIGIKW